MRLQDHLETRRGEAGRLAAIAKVTGSFIRQVAAGKRPMPADKAAAIEAATGRAVRRWEMRPADWHLIWPELIGTEGAPGIPQEARDAA